MVVNECHISNISGTMVQYLIIIYMYHGFAGDKKLKMLQLLEK